MFSKVKGFATSFFHSPKEESGHASSSENVAEGSSSEVTVYWGTHNPTKSWQELSVKQTCTRVKPLPLDTPIYEDKVRFVCMSDTHNRTNRLPGVIPMGDVFLHAGDFTVSGAPKEVEGFNSFLGDLPHPHKIVIAGNHELSFDPVTISGRTAYDLKKVGLELWTTGSLSASSRTASYLKEKGLEKMSDVLTNCTYLEDAEITVAGIRIYGSPWQPEFGDWAFNLERGQRCLDVWNMIPEGVDILMTHGPPIGHGDTVTSGNRAGCVELLSTIQKRVKPKYHLFGHIHEAYGITTDGHTTFINASTCNRIYLPVNPPVIFDLPLPEGVSKHDITAPVKSGLNVENLRDNVSEDGSVEFIDFEDEGDQDDGTPI